MSPGTGNRQGKQSMGFRGLITRPKRDHDKMSPCTKFMSKCLLIQVIDKGNKAWASEAPKGLCQNVSWYR